MQFAINALIRLEQPTIGDFRRQILSRLEIASGDGIVITVGEREPHQRHRLHAIAVVLHRKPYAQMRGVAAFRFHAELSHRVRGQVPARQYRGAEPSIQRAHPRAERRVQHQLFTLVMQNLRSNNTTSSTMPVMYCHAGRRATAGDASRGSMAVSPLG